MTVIGRTLGQTPIPDLHERWYALLESAELTIRAWHGHRYAYGPGLKANLTGLEQSILELRTQIERSLDVELSREQKRMLVLAARTATSSRKRTRRAPDLVDPPPTTP